MDNPKDLYYTENHEWVRIEETRAYVGISDHAQQELGDIVYVELPEIDTEVEAGEEVLTVESVKAAAPVYSPVTGTIVEINEELEDNPDFLNEGAFEHHIFVVEIVDRDELKSLMAVEEYDNFLEEA